MTILASVDGGAYRVTLLLHVFCAIVGLGGVTLNGVYGVASRKAIGHGGLAIVRANAKATSIAELFIYAVPVFGFALVGMSDDRWAFDQTWLWLSLIVYAIALGISLGLLLPAFRKYEALVDRIETGGTAPTPADETALDALLKKQAGLGGSLHLIVVILLVLMIWKPGS